MSGSHDGLPDILSFIVFFIVIVSVNVYFKITFLPLMMTMPR